MIFENNPKLKKAASSFLLVVVAILIIVLVSPFVKTDTSNKVENKPQVVSSPHPLKTDYKGEVPPMFPQKLLVEKDAKITQSYIKEYINGLQSSVLFSSKNTVAENFLIYEKTVKEEGWTIVDTKQDASQATISAKNSIGVLSVFLVKRKATSTPDFVKSYVIINTFKNK